MSAAIALVCRVAENVAIALVCAAIVVGFCLTFAPLFF
jgi:multisubunit Na+/H+ antiporter MnhC subunit